MSTGSSLPTATTPTTTTEVPTATAVPVSTTSSSAEVGRSLPRWIYLGIMFSMVVVATAVVSSNVDRKLVILIAQVFTYLYKEVTEKYDLN